ncbi:ATP-binding protein [Pseudomonas sp. FP2196]|uniref:NACHT domain-containing protein n=1 Tax=Pseudomonas sp. FP2196 TaxID=2954086 RepID=UPI0027377202|nr:ATP-binding protein [Pseudomonas sp. FP2196]WLH38046.1 ATP-binding protein [Pseudomonas sp. FP2196]
MLIQQQGWSFGLMEGMSYFPRHLRVIKVEETAEKLDEQALIEIQGPKVILGEPGMGKSELIREIGRRLEVKIISATRFMNHARPESLVVAGKPLLIDGLDEAMARREGDAVDLIFSKLEEAGSPDFILSCRAREWQSRNEGSIHEIYDADPNVLVLEALSRGEAEDFLKHRYPDIDAAKVLYHFDANGVSDLYANPLTLGLIGRVAETGAELPQSRAALFERVCALIWPEFQSERQKLGFGLITQEQALCAAGALCAGMLLAGADAISEASPSQLLAGDVQLADLLALPGAEVGELILSSKLFQTIETGRAAPIHRVIAEYLGARWLAQEAKTNRVQRRLLKQLNGSGNVPSSLRGLHAWIAYHSASMAKDVITADPFAVLRYGDDSRMTSEQAQCMFQALNKLASNDPFFRAQDWESRVAAGLMHPKLIGEIQALIATPDSNRHLRFLLIEGLKGTAMASDLADTLESIVFSLEHPYTDRVAASSTLMEHRDKSWWQATVVSLVDQCTDESARLARDVMQKIDFDVTDEVLVMTLLTSMELTRCPLFGRSSGSSLDLFHHRRFGQRLPIERVRNVLDLFAEFAITVTGRHHRGPGQLAELITVLVKRAIDAKSLDAATLPAVWNWLGALQQLSGMASAEAKSLKHYFDENESLRRAIQLYALYVARPNTSFWLTACLLDRRLVGLTGEDILWQLEEMKDRDNQDVSHREDWRDLIRLGRQRTGMSAAELARRSGFQRDDQELYAFIHLLDNPEKPIWQIEDEQMAAREEARKRRLHEQDRAALTSDKASLRAGEFNQINRPALRYLGLDDMSLDPVKGLNALQSWLGDTLTEDALAGLEAVLHRSDLPTPSDVARSFADGEHYDVCYSIMAGLLERQRLGLRVDDLAVDTRKVGLLLCLDEGTVLNGSEVGPLREKLLRSLIEDEQDSEGFAKLWLEPTLESGKEHICGMHHFFNEECWHTTSVRLSGLWLMSLETLHESIEVNLIDHLARSGNLSMLALIAQHREQSTPRNQSQRFNWLAVDVLTRFDPAKPELSGIGRHHPEFIWPLRDRFANKNRGLMLSVEQAKWVIEQFRGSWPFAELPRVASGDQNPYDATRFLTAMIDRLANDTSAQSSAAFDVLNASPRDSYSDLIRHMAAQQRQARSEKEFTPLLPKSLGELLTEGHPSNAEDLKALVIEELADAQKVLLGDELDQYRDFWSGDVPFGENRCRDRLAALIKTPLEQYGIRQLTEADMPDTKRADLAFAYDRMQLPMEVKGQWHPDVWDAATGQLDKQYLIDWRSEDRGIYCVFWFGKLPGAPTKNLKTPPAGVKTPESAEEMKEILISRIPEQRRSHIDVVVLDLTAGQPKTDPKPKVKAKKSQSGSS